MKAMPDRDEEYEMGLFIEIAKRAKGILDGPPLYTSSEVCNRCVHLYSIAARTCAAFPRGIPAEIWDGKHEHQVPFAGDHGIQFEEFQFADEPSH
jgi:hypothetical protein